jgi:hypothetical protein
VGTPEVGIALRRFASRKRRRRRIHPSRPLKVREVSGIIISKCLGIHLFLRSTG